MGLRKPRNCCFWFGTWLAYSRHCVSIRTQVPFRCYLLFGPRTNNGSRVLSPTFQARHPDEAPPPFMHVTRHGLPTYLGCSWSLGLCRRSLAAS